MTFIIISISIDFPEAFKLTASGQGRNLKKLQEATNLNWTFVRPAAIFDAEGKRTGSYQKGINILLVNSEKESYISYADYVIAIVDEIEQEKHLNERFTVGGEK